MIMFCSLKNSYLQLVCAVNPRVINKAVDQAMEKENFDPHTALPAALRLESMQPSLYAPVVDVTRASLGFGRIGLKILMRNLHSPDKLKRLQALHSLLDQVQISENAMFLIDMHVVYRLIDLMLDKDPIVKEKVCLILTRLATYYQGTKHIMSRPVIIENLMRLIVRDQKEIRYTASYTLKTLSKDRCASEVIMRNEQVIDDLIKMIKNDHTGIVVLHLSTLTNLAEWDPIRPLKANAFQVMLTLLNNSDPRVVSGAMECTTQLCKHHIGKDLADDHDLTLILKGFLNSSHIEVIISAVGLMMYTTLTTRSKWRAKEFCNELTQRLVQLCSSHKPLLQIRCMQVLINLCDCPDIRYHMKMHWKTNVDRIKIRTHEEWDGTSETTSSGLETGHNYRSMFIQGVETIKNDCEDKPEVVNVHSYLRRVQDVKTHLLQAINWKPY